VVWWNKQNTKRYHFRLTWKWSLTLHWQLYLSVCLHWLDIWRWRY